VGSGTDAGKDGRLPLAEASTGGSVRIRGMDAGQPSPTQQVRRGARGQAGAGRQARVNAPVVPAMCLSL